MTEKKWTDEDLIKAKSESFKSGQLHTTSSKETLIKFNQMNEKIDEIKKQIDNLPTIDSMKLANEKLIEKVMEKAEKKFASKPTERIVYGMVGMILLYVFGKLLNLV